MTLKISEKLQIYRKLNKLTQKKLSELSGVSEISIRKYEAGDRFPKPEQLKKIAAVLEIGGNELLEIELETLKVDTIGDAMSLFYLLKEKLGINYSYEELENGAIDPNSIHINFKYENFNKYLERIVTEERMADELSAELSNLDDENSRTELLTDKFLLDLTKKELTSNKELINEAKS